MLCGTCLSCKWGSLTQFIRGWILPFRKGSWEVLWWPILHWLNVFAIIFYRTLYSDTLLGMVFWFNTRENKSTKHSHVSMLFSSSAAVTRGLSYDLSIAARKLSLQPRPLMIRECGLLRLISPFSVASATAVCRLSRELDFFRPREGPTTCSAEPMERGNSVTEARKLMGCDS